MTQSNKLEFLLATPNILAQFACMANLAFYANVLYSVGYLPFIWRNYKRGDKFQLNYFSFIWVMAVFGVVAYLMGWDLPGILMELI